MNQKVLQNASCKRWEFMWLVRWHRDHTHYIVKKLSQFSGLVNEVRHLYLSKCLLLFYNSNAESVIRYGLLVYGRAANTNLENRKSGSRTKQPIVNGTKQPIFKIGQNSRF